MKLADLGDAQLITSAGGSAGAFSGESGSPGVMAAARVSARGLGNAVVTGASAVQKAAAILAESSGAVGLGGWLGGAGGLLAGLAGAGGADDEADGITAGTPEWMAPELLATTVPAPWMDPDASGVYVVDKMVPGLRKVVAEWQKPGGEHHGTHCNTTIQRHLCDYVTL